MEVHPCLTPVVVAVQVGGWVISAMEGVISVVVAV